MVMITKYLETCIKIHFFFFFGVYEGFKVIFQMKQHHSTVHHKMGGRDFILITVNM